MRNEAFRAGQLAIAQQHAASRGGQCLSLAYERNDSPMACRCAAGHEWPATFASVLHAGTWCGRCAGNVVDPDERLLVARVYAAKHGGECLAGEYKSAHTRVLWRCAKLHEWPGTYNNVVDGATWCPTCARGLSQRRLRLVAEQLLGAPLPPAHPEWLKNPATGHALELDGYNPTLRVALECQGPQHYGEYSTLGVDERRALVQDKHDAVKRELCAAHGVRLIEIDQEQNLADAARLMHELWALHPDLAQRMRRPEDVVLPTWVKADTWSLADLQRWAALRGGECLSPVFTLSNRHYTWRCAAGHEWDQTFEKIRAGHWCKECHLLRVRGSVEAMQAKAAENGGKCLSTEYTRNNDHYLWQCAAGHSWAATWDKVRRGQWCRECWRAEMAWRARPAAPPNQMPLDL